MLGTTHLITAHSGKQVAQLGACGVELKLVHWGTVALLGGDAPNSSGVVDLTTHSLIMMDASHLDHCFELQVFEHVLAI